MVMVGQHRRLAQPLRWTRAGRVFVLLAGVLTLAAIIALVIAITSSSNPAKRGCISVTFASTVGGATVQSCGHRARAACEAPRQSSFSGDLQALRSACARAGLPFDVASG